MKKKKIEYKKRSQEETAKLRKEFNSTKRKEFLQDLGNDPAKVGKLKEAGFSDSQIHMLRNGKVPDNYQVHHKLPLDDGGTNSMDNLVLI